MSLWTLTRVENLIVFKNQDSGSHHLNQINCHLSAAVRDYALFRKVPLRGTINSKQASNVIWQKAACIADPLQLRKDSSELDSHLGLMHGSLDHMSQHPKRHLDRFSRFCTVYISVQHRQTDIVWHLSQSAASMLCIRCGLKLFHTKQKAKATFGKHSTWHMTAILS